jgi:hypothetical protein
MTAIEQELQRQRDECKAKAKEYETFHDRIRDYCLECCGEIGPECGGGFHGISGEIEDWCRIYLALKEE